ncbi:pyridoxal phosphate-dependent aminotransferase [Propionimicrobium lymphophilum]|uniref:pyridoxal phosphate-dependent aminotransferase n=1 Tax=Propionimicrobium lymphophilum TaxID=33012 RepID=UPI003EC6EF48
MRFSNRTLRNQPNSISIASENRTVALLNLSDSNPTHNSLQPKSAQESYDADPRGSLTARSQLAEFIAANQNRSVDTNNLHLLSSTSQGYSWLIKLLCDPGDAVLAPRPGYPLISNLAALECAEVLDYTMHWDGSWWIDTAQLETLAAENQERLKALIAINPNNPTGSYLAKDERTKIISICQKYHLALIADEVFFEYELNGCGQRLAGEDSVLTFALDGLSKNLGAPGAKLAWLQTSGPKEQVDEALERLDVIADSYLPMSQLITAQLPNLLAEIPSQQKRIGQRTRRNLQTLKEIVEFSRTGTISILSPEGGWSVLLRFPSFIDEENLVLELIEKHQITVQPGYFFDLLIDGFVSLSLLLEPKVFRHAANTLVMAIDEIVEANS